MHLMQNIAELFQYIYLKKKISTLILSVVFLSYLSSK